MIKPTLLTYDNAKEICTTNGNLLFYESVFYIDGYKISIFNYRVAQFNNFVDPLVNSDINAFEMRGLTFVFNIDGTLYNRYLMIPKFFNINQVPMTMYELVSKYEIDSITNKEDGSLIGFIRLPNGRVLGRTKMTFESDQAIEANTIYENNENIKKMVNYGLDNNISLFFEYVSFNNKVVLDYKETMLILLNGRRNDNGEFIDINMFNNYNVPICKFEKYDNIDEIIALSKTSKDKEGWVIKFTNGLMIKVKTKWYFNLHHLNFDVIDRENDIIRLILNEEMDDAISQLPTYDTDRRKFIDDITIKVNEKYTYMIDEIDRRLLNFDGDVKKFAITAENDMYKHLCLGVINGKDKYQLAKDLILKNTFRLKNARNWLNID